MKQIESTGHVQTIAQREIAAHGHFIRSLARIGQGLLILGKREAAMFCDQAIKAIEK